MKDLLILSALALYAFLIYKLMKFTTRKRIEFYQELIKQHPQLTITPEKTVEGSLNGLQIKFYEISSDATTQNLEVYHNLSIPKEAYFTLKTNLFSQHFNRSANNTFGHPEFDKRFDLKYEGNPELAKAAIDEKIMTLLLQSGNQLFGTISVSEDKISASLSGELSGKIAREGFLIYLDTILALQASLEKVLGSSSQY